MICLLKLSQLIILISCHLTIIRSGIPRLVPQNRGKLESKYEAKKPVNSFVTVNDVKGLY